METYWYHNTDNSTEDIRSTSSCFVAESGAPIMALTIEKFVRWRIEKKTYPMHTADETLAWSRMHIRSPTKSGIVPDNCGLPG